MSEHAKRLEASMFTTSKSDGSANAAFKSAKHECIAKHPIDQARLLGKMQSPAGMLYEMREVTPHLAEEIVSHWNSHNRRMNDDYVKAYETDMRAGVWQENGDSIRFNDKGILIDGQKRMEALSRSSKPLVCLVVRALPTKAQQTIDIGQRRSDADEEFIKGNKYSTERASWVRLIGVALSGSNKRMGLADKNEIKRQFKSDIEWAVAGAMIHGTAMKNGPIMAAFILAHHRFPQETQAFVEMCRTGANLLPGSPALALREYSYRLSTIRQLPRDVTLKALRAVRAHIENERITALMSTHTTLAFFTSRKAR